MSGSRFQIYKNLLLNKVETTHQKPLVAAWHGEFSHERDVARALCSAQVAIRKRVNQWYLLTTLHSTPRSLNSEKRFKSRGWPHETSCHAHKTGSLLQTCSAAKLLKCYNAAPPVPWRPKCGLYALERTSYQLLRTGIEWEMQIKKKRFLHFLTSVGWLSVLWVTLLKSYHFSLSSKVYSIPSFAKPTPDS